MPRDLIGELGLLALGSRFRRLGERLQAGVAARSRELDLSLQPAHYPLLVALAEQPRTVAELVVRLDIAQPGVTRSVTRLIGDGIVEPAIVARADPQDDDGRRRPLRLTARGEALLARARAELLPQVERALAAICAEYGDGLLAALDRLDDALRVEPLDARLR